MIVRRFCIRSCCNSRLSPVTPCAKRQAPTVLFQATGARPSAIVGPPSSTRLLVRAASTNSTNPIDVTTEALLDRLENDELVDDDIARPDLEEEQTTMTTPPYVLPSPSWSLKDLNLGSSPAEREVELSSEEVKKICAIAHIALDPDGEGTFDAASATRDVGAMLRTMQSMRTGWNPEETPEARLVEAGTEDEEAEPEGPWGNAATWTAPLHEDVVSDGDIQKDVVGNAARTYKGFFTARRVVGGVDETVP